MKWILNYLDVKVGEPLGEVENRCFDDWEPFAVTLLNTGLLEQRVQRFWFKKCEGLEPKDPLVGQIFPLILREDMEELLAYAHDNDQCDNKDFEKIDKIAERWNLSK